METGPSTEILTVSIDDADEDAIEAITDGLLDLYPVGADVAWSMAASLVIDAKVLRSVWGTRHDN